MSGIDNVSLTNWYSVGFSERIPRIRQIIIANIIVYCWYTLFVSTNCSSHSGVSPSSSIRSFAFFILCFSRKQHFIIQTNGNLVLALQETHYLFTVFGCWYTVHWSNYEYENIWLQLAGLNLSVNTPNILCWCVRAVMEGHTMIWKQMRYNFAMKPTINVQTAFPICFQAVIHMYACTSID